MDGSYQRPLVHNINEILMAENDINIHTYIHTHIYIYIMKRDIDRNRHRAHFIQPVMSTESSR